MAREDSCNLLKSVVLVATPPKQQARTAAFIARTKLANCHKYAENP